MSPIPKVESSETLKTTDSMKRKARVVSRFFINLLKLLRFCKKHKKTQKDTS